MKSNWITYTAHKARKQTIFTYFFAKHRQLLESKFHLKEEKKKRAHVIHCNIKQVVSMVPPSTLLTITTPGDQGSNLPL